MRCFRKSTRWCADALAAAALCVTLAPVAHAAGTNEPCVPGISRAIVAALKARMSGAIEYRLTDVSCVLEIAGDGNLLATLAPGARIGRPMRFAIARPAARPSAAAVRVGEAVATVNAVGPVVRAARDVARSAVLESADVEQVEGSLDGMLVRPVLTLTDVVGGRVTRPLHTGDVLDATAIVPVPVVRSGDRVRAIVRLGEIEVETIVVASDNGAADQVIRVVNAQTRRAMRARVVAKGEVEVVDGR